jgi:hypothetical protein
MKLSSVGASYRPLPSPGSLQWGGPQQILFRVLVVAGLVLFASQSNAAAKSGYEVHPGGIMLILPVERRADDVISVSANEQQQRVQFAVEGPSSKTEYSTKGHVSSQRIKATFGTLGKIDVRLRLVPHPPDRPHEGRCKGRAPLYQEGTYSGTIEFAHLGDVPKVSTRHGRAYFKRRFRQVCKRQRPPSKLGGKNGPKHKLEVGILTVRGKSEGRTVLLEASILALKGNPARSAGYLSVVGYERHEGVRIAKTTGTSIDHHSFAMSSLGETPETVAVELPKPFAGDALYSRSSGFPPSWIGDLSVELPGADRVPLAGPGFSAVFCRGSLIAKLKPCL